MKPIVIHAAKDLRIEETRAEAPGPGQVEIALEAGGICGSDLHYYNHGGFGAVRLREPMILGHEVAGTVKALGGGVAGLAVGDRVAVSPSRPCNACHYCLQGHAEPMPQHALLRQRHAHAAHPGRLPPAPRRGSAGNATRSPTASPSTRPPSPSPSRSRCMPSNRAGSLLGKRVLVTGCGPIGALCDPRRTRPWRPRDRRHRCHRRRAGEGHGDRRRPHDQCRDRRRQARRLQCRQGQFRRDVRGLRQRARACARGSTSLRPRGVLVQLGLGGDVVTAAEPDRRQGNRDARHASASTRNSPLPST